MGSLISFFFQGVILVVVILVVVAMTDLVSVATRTAATSLAGATVTSLLLLRVKTASRVDGTSGVRKLSQEINTVLGVTWVELRRVTSTVDLEVIPSEEIKMSCSTNLRLNQSLWIWAVQQVTSTLLTTTGTTLPSSLSHVIMSAQRRATNHLVPP